MQLKNQRNFLKKLSNNHIVTNTKVALPFTIRQFTVLGSVGLFGLVLSACSQPTNDSSVEQASTSNSDSETMLRIATEGAYAPFNYTNADGSLAGFDVEVANALCADMQVQCEVIAQDWDGIIPGLKSKKYDAIVAAMSVTPERQEQVDFTEPYFNNSLVFLAKKDSSFNPDNIDNINNHSIATQRSTISSQWLEKNYPNAQMKLHNTLNDAFLDLESGRVDAMVSDKAPAIEWLKSDAGKNFAIKGQEIDIHDNFAIAVRKNDTSLRDKLNTALAHIKENGTYQTLQDKYFLVDKSDKPKDKTTTDEKVDDKSVAGEETTDNGATDAQADKQTSKTAQ